MTLTQNIYSAINLAILLLKSIYIFPGFSLFTAIFFLLLITVAMWLLRAVGTLFHFGGGGDGE